MSLSKNTKKLIAPFADIAALPFVLIGGFPLRVLRRFGVEFCPLSRNTLLKLGVFPIEDHYYEPLFNAKRLSGDLNELRPLAFDLREKEQLELIGRFHYTDELKNVPTDGVEGENFFYNNRSFSYGDAEILYSIIRFFKPKRIIEIGSGNSTLLAIKAREKNAEEGYTSEHICIEPYEMPWLEKNHIKVIRKRVEDVDAGVFKQLDENDILFIDSSHMIRPQGDVLKEYLEIIPGLNKGVIVHVHDIFTPRDYRSDWIKKEIKFWNEQYLLEAFLTMNDRFNVLCAVNFLKHEHFSELVKCCPMLKEHVESEPGSFWIRKVG
ncbi:MAG: class I SAM-dependent methyltransferase [Lachnospiraceae bacterium]|nr:class I SAM-dependent methyltransferase [Lachnospiraceae bacterium]